MIDSKNAKKERDQIYQQLNRSRCKRNQQLFFGREGNLQGYAPVLARSRFNASATFAPYKTVPNAAPRNRVFRHEKSMFFFSFLLFLLLPLLSFNNSLSFFFPFKYSNQEEQDLKVGDTTSRIVARCKSGFDSMMEGFQNNQALPWEFRDPEKLQASDYV